MRTFHPHTCVEAQKIGPRTCAKTSKNLSCRRLNWNVFQRHANSGREMWKMTTYKITYLHELAINLVRWQLRRHHEKGLGVDNDFFQFNQNCYGYINVAFLYGGLMGSLKGLNLGNKLDWNPGGIIPSWAGELYKNKDLHNSTRLRPLPKSRFFCLRRSLWFCLQIVVKIFQNQSSLMGSFKRTYLGNKLDWNPGEIIPSWAGVL